MVHWSHEEATCGRTQRSILQGWISHFIIVSIYGLFGWKPIAAKKPKIWRYRYIGAIPKRWNMLHILAETYSKIGLKNISAYNLPHTICCLHIQKSANFGTAATNGIKKYFLLILSACLLLCSKKNIQKNKIKKIIWIKHFKGNGIFLRSNLR